MKIYTKKGDRGTTSLLTGEKVTKDDPRLEAYGSIDELISYVGLIRDLTGEKYTRGMLLQIQDRLMRGASLLAAGKQLSGLPVITGDDITALENAIDKMNSQIPELHHFILPGGDTLASHCHVARTICRRAERNATAIIGTDDPHRQIVLQYLNRLSDYLFVLARFIIYQNKNNETIWLSED